MKKALLACSVLLFLLTSTALAQSIDSTFEPSTKFGKPSDEELSITTYAPDTSAAAVVLHASCEVKYELGNNNFQLMYDYTYKIKVLKSEGSSYATVEIPYYSNERNASLRLQPNYRISTEKQEADKETIGCVKKMGERNQSISPATFFREVG